MNTTHNLETAIFPERAGFIGAHPDDIEVMMGAAVHATSTPFAIVATDGERSTRDFRTNYLCWRTR
jgi:LmbE family N-acetylglucosaminyl deacetylase